MRLEEITAGAVLRGVVPDGEVSVVAVTPAGPDAVLLVYRTLPDQRLGEQLLQRSDEARLRAARRGRLWSFDGDGKQFRLAVEAYRIRLAWLFDPMMAVHTSRIEPLPHQIAAVYERMLPMQPLRFLLADDPGAGKTIMTGLYIRELMLRGDLRRCLIVCPGALVEQWQDELSSRFDLHFEIFTSEQMENCPTGNWFANRPLVLARLDKMARNRDLQEKLRHPDCWWDLVVVDEAHKMSAHFFGSELKRTRRYQLGQLLSARTRHFLLLTATPHNGRGEDFQLFLALLDGDRFEGRFRDGEREVDVSDLMRRVVKEDLVRFDGTRLFPERYAQTIPFELSPAEARLYADVTEYVRSEFNRAEQNLQGKKKLFQNVGFALTALQRRLASSPEAILRSLERRRERLEQKLREAQLERKAEGESLRGSPRYSWLEDEEDLDDFDDLPEDEREGELQTITSEVTAAATLRELRAEIDTLTRLEQQARELRRAGTDAKWQQLADVLQYLFQPLANQPFPAASGEPEDMPPPPRGPSQKLVIFTEFRDTLNYLRERCENFFARPDAVLVIHGGIGREERRKVQERFLNDPEARLLIATDAAGEGINLQRAHLMVNYDLPWNPNRIEQRFGRIHRIGQTRPCYLWNFVARETREGYVYYRLLEKLEEVRRALGGQVFDVLGQMIFDGRPLRELLIEAIRHGDELEIRRKLEAAIESTVSLDQIRALLREDALSRDVIPPELIHRVREDMERAEARRLQPHHVGAWFREAFASLGGTMYPREAGRWEITHVPAVIRHRDRQLGQAEPVLIRYERITFDKNAVNVPGAPPAVLITPGHPLAEAVADLILERGRVLFRQGAALVDDRDPGLSPRLLLLIEHAVRDGMPLTGGEGTRVISRELAFVERLPDGQWVNAGPAPCLDYRPLTDADPPLETLLARPECAGFAAPSAETPDTLEAEALVYAARYIAGPHLDRIRAERLPYLDNVWRKVQERLIREIQYWDHRAAELRLQELRDNPNLNMNSAEAARRADELNERLRRREKELQLQRNITADLPVVLTAVLILPAGLLRAVREDVADVSSVLPPRDTQAAATRARDAVMRLERALGFVPVDRETERLGYDIESRDPRSGSLRFIEVKGRVPDADTVTFTRNEVITALNRPDTWILALVLEENDGFGVIHYIRQPFQREPDFGVTRLDYRLDELLQREKETYAIPPKTD